MDSMKPVYLRECANMIAQYYEYESIGNTKEDICNVFDILEMKLNFLFSLVEELVDDEQDSE